MKSNDSSVVGLRPASDVSRALFEQFSRRLIGLARCRLDPWLKHKVDPEDVAQSAFKSFFLRYRTEQFAAQGSNALWSLLTLITLRKCSDRARYYRAERRDMAQEAGTPITGEPEPWSDAVSREPTPEHAMVLAETIEQVLRSVSADERLVGELSLQGYSTQEISQQLRRAERSVRRLRERVRKHLERLQGAEGL